MIKEAIKKFSANTRECGYDVVTFVLDQRTVSGLGRESSSVSNKKSVL